jgi:hypothetical protein
MITENEKVDCIDSLSFGIHRTKLWREKMLAKHPSDPRNGRAAECLGKLAIDAKDLSDKDFALLQPYCNWASERWREAISQTSRLAGFQHKINDLPSFVKTLVGVLRS